MYVVFQLHFVYRGKRKLTAHPSGTPAFVPGFSEDRVVESLVFCVVLCTSLFVLFLWPLYCLSSDLQLLITPLVSSNFSSIFMRRLCFVLDQYTGLDFIVLTYCNNNPQVKTYQKKV